MKVDKNIKNRYFNERPLLVKRFRSKVYIPEAGCLYCGNKTFRFYSSVYGKKYFQCEKCRGINH